MKDIAVVDVIMPTYNGLPWLKESVESVLSQTHSKLELYVIDDGSTDKTESYIKSLKDSRVHYHKKKNGGQAQARNFGIRVSSSPFIAFLDSDDIWYPEKLEKQLAVMQAKAKVGMVYGHHYLIDEENVIQGNLRHWYRGNIFDDLCGGNFISGSASMVLVRRDVLYRAGFFREDLVNGEDWELLLRIARICEVDFVPEIIAAIRQRIQSTQTNSRKMADGLVYAFEEMQKNLDLTKVQTRKLARACLYPAGSQYIRMGDRKAARKAFIKLFRNDMHSFFSLSDWGFVVRPSFFMVMLGNNSLFVRLHLYYVRIRKRLSLSKQEVT